LIYGVPTTYVVSPQGQVVDSHMGAITVEQLRDYFGKDNSMLSSEDHNKPCTANVC